MMTFNSSNLYNLFKPINNQDLITNYKVYIGGTFQAVDYASGVIIISLLPSKPITSSVKIFDEVSKEFIEYSLLSLNYQVDIYKQNSENINFIEVEVEATKIREWLKSYEVTEYLETLNSAITPTYSLIRYDLNLEINQVFINKASFDFTIYAKEVIRENSEWVANAVTNNKIIMKG